jgi:hypothetical protein
MVPSIWIGFIQIEMDLMAYLRSGVTKMDISRNNDSTKKSVNVVANDVKYPIWIHLNIIIQWMVF